MMNCKTAEKYLYLFRNDELSDSEKALLEKHLNICSSCNNLLKELNDYKNKIQGLQNHKSVLTNPGQLTDNIMSAISVDKTENSAKFIQFVRNPLFRIAASILIILQVVTFLYQNKHISDSLTILTATIETTKIQNKASQEEFGKECIEQSKTILTDIFGNENSGLKSHAYSISRKLSQEEIETYALQICEYSYQIQKAGMKLKRELLTDLLINELNIKL